ncbi:MAG: trypsin-like peptidase domain-containing protein [Solirubrobacterales bacterium]|nr:trypsin-like peptidase domain-containing protein [Solirubrobacterales bacterium]
MSRLTRLFPILAAAVVGGAIALVASSGGSTTTPAVTTTVVQSGGSSSIPTSLTSTKGLTVNQIYRQDGPGVVDIVVTSQSQGFGGFGGQSSQGEGAGVVYDNKGDILTDEHVVSGASSVTVNFQDGLKANAKVLGTDPSTDVAVIHVDVPTSELHPIAFANSSTAQVGDPVVAIGSPFSLPETTTAGIVSAVGRSIQAPNSYTITGAIQTDAPINPGNSGCPLLDAAGDVLGLNDQIQTNSGSSAGVGFAVPANTVARIADQIIAGHSVKHSYVGVELNPSSTSGGAQITTVQPSSPAENAGLQSGDVVTAINGKAVASTEQFIETVDNYPPGQTITLQVKRGGATKSVQVQLGTRPQSAQNG